MTPKNKPQKEKMNFRGKSIKRGAITLREVYLYELGENSGKQQERERVIEIIKDKVTIRKVSENRNVSEYECIFSINYLEELIAKIKEAEA